MDAPLPTPPLPPAAPAVPVPPVVQAPRPAVVPPPAMFGNTPTKVPSSKQQSWGALISIIIIVLMIVVGAFYAWGKRISEEQGFPTGSSAQ